MRWNTLEYDQIPTNDILTKTIYHFKMHYGVQGQAREERK
jgi:hypothetical protein